MPELNAALLTVAYLAGVLTIVSPCILPVLPFVFARADQPFVRSGLPILTGMAMTFAAVATLAAVAGGWVVEANTYGRAIAMVLLTAFGVMLIFPGLADRVMQPVVRLGSNLSDRASVGAASRTTSVWPSFLLGAATGLLWAPCAGPVLGLILSSAALNGANVGSSLLLLAYAAGAATSLALALAIGGRVFAVMKRSLGASEWIRRGLGAAVLASVVAIFLGLDTGFLTRISFSTTASLEQGLIDRIRPEKKTVDPAMSSSAETAGPSMMMKGESGTKLPALSVEDGFPSLAGAVQWLNSPPLTPEGLRGKVVLIDFWTYSCINCLRSIPYVRAWAEKYKDQGFVVIGVHTPEFAFERRISNVQRAIADLKIQYPVAIDNEYGIWREFGNEYWPAHYFIDAQGRMRYRHFGEGQYDVSERVIQQLLTEAGNAKPAAGLVSVTAAGAQAPPSSNQARSPETYLGYNRIENFVSPGGIAQDKTKSYAAASAPQLNQWSLAGNWTITGENASLDSAGGRIIFRFHARDVHLVLGPAKDATKVRFRVTIDGKPPGADAGTDVDADGRGVVDSQRLYQLVRQRSEIVDRTFEIEFLDPGVQAYAFTFG